LEKGKGGERDGFSPRSAGREREKKVSPSLSREGGRGSPFIILPSGKRVRKRSAVYLRWRRKRARLPFSRGGGEGRGGKSLGGKGPTSFSSLSQERREGSSLQSCGGGGKKKGGRKKETLKMRGLAILPY